MNHQVDHADQYPRLAALRQELIVLGQPPVPGQPAEGSLHNPAPFQDDKPLVRALDDLDDPGKPIQCPGDELTGVAAVGPDQLQTRKQPGQPLERQPSAIAVLNVGGVDDNRQDQPQRVDDDVTLAPDYLFARVVAPAKAPFSTLLTLWLSMIAALGVACLPALSRTFSRRVS
jgi:hypothetical protein